MAIQHSLSRRTAITAGLSTTAALTLPGLAAASDEETEAKKDDIEVRKKTIKKSEDFILNHYTVDGDELLLVEHLSGEKKGTISGDPINTGAEKASNNDSRDSASPSKLESAEKNPEN
ncbi:hypothetical protein U4E84_16765, partial [Halorubrum sp. AD140]|uniref:hypothetical protein n=1 Tax=Halorubrum sp. AD140 TaxID=3050073 RepID=UPI002ACD09C3